jgi:hypothetical protein
MIYWFIGSNELLVSRMAAGLLISFVQ